MHTFISWEEASPAASTAIRISQELMQPLWSTSLSLYKSWWREQQVNTNYYHHADKQSHVEYAGQHEHTRNFSILVHRILNSTSPNLPLPSFWRTWCQEKWTLEYFSWCRHGVSEISEHADTRNIVRQHRKKEDFDTLVKCVHSVACSELDKTVDATLMPAGAQVSMCLAVFKSYIIHLPALLKLID